MSKYNYKAKRRNGKITSGTILADSKQSAKNELYNRGLTPLKLVRVSSGDGPSQRKGISKFIFIDKDANIHINIGGGLPSTKELALFTKQFSLMIENGINLPQALQLLKESQSKPNFADTIEAIGKDVETGATLSEAIEIYPTIFDNLYTAMIRAGEASGKLDIILRQLVEYIEKSAKIKSQIKSAMAYPTIIVAVAVGVITMLLVFVVPGFAKQFQDSGKDLPGLTQLVIDMSNWLVDSASYIVAILVASVFLFRYWIKTETGRYSFDYFLLKSPIIGDLMTKISIGRFSSTLSTMLSSGVAILESLQICASSSGNKRIEKFILNIKEEVQRGEPFNAPLQNSSLIPPLVASMVKVGEATGKLPETLKKVTDIYEDEVDTAIDTMTAMIEPLLIVVIGSIVGFIVLAMYLPVFDMASNMGG